MNTKLKYILGLTVCLMLVALNTKAQKFGYVDSGAILESLPKVKEAESNLDALNKQLQAKGQKMMEDFQAKYEELQRRVQAGDITPKDQETQSAALEEQRQKIVQYDQDMQSQLADKRDTLLAPILKEVKTAIQTVAKDNGYTYVFDGSPGVGVLLYADETTNLTALVKEKLGVK
ncbi:MAG TPA: OmpH family outer membrane protein [Saprospiraceae bacterium]|nr:OmpH family outer membrane protein [Saprospiraceae bacterium]